MKSSTWTIFKAPHSAQLHPYQRPLAIKALENLNHLKEHLKLSIYILYLYYFTRINIEHTKAYFLDDSPEKTFRTTWVSTQSTWTCCWNKGKLQTSKKPRGRWWTGCRTTMRTVYWCFSDHLKQEPGYHQRCLNQPEPEEGWGLLCRALVIF